MKKYFTLLLAVSALAISPVMAQKDFREGYILQNGDTIKGLVANQNERRNAINCIFKANTETSDKNYSPLEIKGYGLEGKHFVATALTGNSGKKQTKFLQLLVKGKASLYTFKDSASTEHFYIYKDDKLQELEQKVKPSTDPWTGNKVKIVDRIYLGTLANAFQDCKNLSKSFVKTQLKTNSLTNLFIQYNNCSSPKSLSYVRQTPKTKVVWGPIIGSQFSSLKINAENYYLSIPESYKSKAGIYGGGFINIASPKFIDKISFQLEATYTKNSYSATFQQAGEFGRNNSYKINFDVNYLKFPFLIRYTFPQGKIRPFFNIGVSNAFSVKFKQNEIKESTYFNIYYKDEGPVLKNIRKHNQGYLVGIGANFFYNKNYIITLEGRYEKANGFSYAAAIETVINTFYLQMGIGF